NHHDVTGSTVWGVDNDPKGKKEREGENSSLRPGHGQQQSTKTHAHQSPRLSHKVVMPGTGETSNEALHPPRLKKASSSMRHTMKKEK
ncbi:hypothetical protein KI387_041854, partial [Taxus chinensis]